MNIRTKEGTISLTNETPDAYIGVFSRVTVVTAYFIRFLKVESLS